MSSLCTEGHVSRQNSAHAPHAKSPNSTKVIAKYPTGYAVPLFDALTAKNIKTNTAVNQPSVLGSLLVYGPLALLSNDVRNLLCAKFSLQFGMAPHAAGSAGGR